MRFIMDKEIADKYRRAGTIATTARDYGLKLIKPEVPLLEIAEKVEGKILELGGGIAFPVNISLNKVAAHYSPRINDTRVFQSGDVVKLDVGAHVDGYIADLARTVEVETQQYSTMIQASSEALDKAVGLMKAGVNLAQVGKLVEETIVGYGYQPIENLTGHELQRYVLHSGVSVPNVGNTSNQVKPEAGDVLAIEPFATNGGGHVIAGEGSNIYICCKSIRSRFIRDHRVKRMFGQLQRRFTSLPFAQRWCQDMFSNVDVMLKKMVLLGLIKQYPQLVEAKGGMVTQREHTVIVEEYGCEVIT
jgi:methionyl aminopeptidase